MGLEHINAVAPTKRNENADLAASYKSSQLVTWTPVFVGVLIFVASVSIYDGYLVIRTGSMIREFELNPMGQYLIKCDDGDIDVFLRVKAAGTLVSLGRLVPAASPFEATGGPGRVRARRLSGRAAVVPRKPVLLIRPGGIHGSIEHSHERALIGSAGLLAAPASFVRLGASFAFAASGEVEALCRKWPSWTN